MDLRCPLAGDNIVHNQHPCTFIGSTLAELQWHIASKHLWWSPDASYRNDGSTFAGTELTRTWAAPDPRVPSEIRCGRRSRQNRTSSAQRSTTRTRSELGAWTARHQAASRRQDIDQLAAADQHLQRRGLSADREATTAPEQDLERRRPTTAFTRRTDQRQTLREVGTQLASEDATPGASRPRDDDAHFRPRNPAGSADRRHELPQAHARPERTQTRPSRPVADHALCDSRPRSCCHRDRQGEHRSLRGANFAYRRRRARPS